MNGDGDTDMVTSLNSHGHGLAWWERSGDAWERHLIFGEPGQDLNRDGVLDIVVGSKLGTFVHVQRPSHE